MILMHLHIFKSNVDIPNLLELPMSLNKSVRNYLLLQHNFCYLNPALLELPFFRDAAGTPMRFSHLALVC